MDTDSAYIALAGDSIDDLVAKQHQEHYFRDRSEWTEACCLARKAFDKRTPELFKVEWCGDGFIGLCSKTYYCFGATDKYSTKGLNKRQNDIDKDAFLAVLLSEARGASGRTQHGPVGRVNSGV